MEADSPEMGSVNENGFERMKNRNEWAIVRAEEAANQQGKASVRGNSAQTAS